MAKSKRKIRNYKDIPDRTLTSEEFKDILLNATPKEKAILNAIGYTDRRLLGENPVITSAQYQKIVDSLKSMTIAYGKQADAETNKGKDSDENKVDDYIDNAKNAFEEYLKWVRAYALLIKVYNYFESYYLSFRYSLNAYESILKEEENRRQEEERLNLTLGDMIGYNPQAAEFLVACWTKHYPNLKLKGDKVSLKVAEDFFSRADGAIFYLTDTIIVSRTLITAIEKFIKSKRFSAIVPPALIERIEEIKNYSHSSPLKDIYEEHGQRLTLHGIGKMKNNDSDIDKKEVSLWINKLKEIENEEKAKY